MDDTALIWSISLGIGLVVIGVVALLLHLVRKAADEINQVAAQIWTHGKLVANNTIQIPLFLSTTNQVVEQIDGNAAKIAAGAAAIEQHAASCPGCPQCVLEH